MRSQILRLPKQLIKKYGTAIIINTFITHVNNIKI